MGRYKFSIIYAMVICLLCITGSIPNNAASEFIRLNIFFITVGAIGTGGYFTLVYTKLLINKIIFLKEYIINTAIIITGIAMIFSFFTYFANLHC